MLRLFKKKEKEVSTKTMTTNEYVSAVSGKVLSSRLSHGRLCLRDIGRVLENQTCFFLLVNIKNN